MHTFWIYTFINAHIDGDFPTNQARLPEVDTRGLQKELVDLRCKIQWHHRALLGSGSPWMKTVWETRGTKVPNKALHSPYIGLVYGSYLQFLIYGQVFFSNASLGLLRFVWKYAAPLCCMFWSSCCFQNCHTCGHTSCGKQASNCSTIWFRLDGIRAFAKSGGLN